MGYACPVCAEPQVDAKHLADHVAFTALLGDDDHESWLEEHAPGWEHDDDASLAERVVPEARELDISAVEGDAGDSAVADTNDGSAVAFDDGDLTVSIEDEGHDPGVAFDDLAGGKRPGDTLVMDEDARAALREAYEMMRTRRGRAADKADGDDAGETE